MPTFTIERTCWVPHYVHDTVEAHTAKEAIEIVLGINWSHPVADWENSVEQHVSGVWAGSVAYMGPALPEEIYRRTK